MIVPNNYFRENHEEMAKEYSRYIVVDVPHMAYPIRKKYEYVIEVSNLRSTFESINLIWKDAGSKKRLDTSLFSDITDAIYSEEPFSEKRLEKYFQVLKEYEEAVDVFQDVGNMVDDVFMDSDVELSLMGLSLSQQRKLEKKKEDEDRLGEFHDWFFRLRYRYTSGKVNYDIFRKMTGERISKLLNEKEKKAA